MEKQQKEEEEKKVQMPVEKEPTSAAVAASASAISLASTALPSSSGAKLAALRAIEKAERTLIALGATRPALGPNQTKGESQATDPYQAVSDTE